MTGQDLVSPSDHLIDCLGFIGLYVLQGQHTARDGTDWWALHCYQQTGHGCLVEAGLDMDLVGICCS